MSVIIDFLNNFFKYNEKSVFIIVDINKMLWFSLKEILLILNYTDIKSAIKRVTVNEEYRRSFSDIQLVNLRDKPLNFQPVTIFISEPGLFQLLSESKRIEAAPFKKELFEVILPSIRKTGEYKISVKDNAKIKELNNKIKMLEKELEDKATENEKLKDEVEFLGSEKKPKVDISDTIYIRKYKVGRNMCFKIGFSSDNLVRKRKKKTETSERNIFEQKIYLDGRQTEACIKNINKFHLLKSKADVLCYISLDSLIKSVNVCIKLLSSHVGTCSHCKKEMNLEEFGEHYKLISTEKK